MLVLIRPEATMMIVSRGKSRNLSGLIKTCDAPAAAEGGAAMRDFRKI
jgi:hypothetical protein